MSTYINPSASSSALQVNGNLFILSMKSMFSYGSRVKKGAGKKAKKIFKRLGRKPSRCKECGTRSEKTTASDLADVSDGWVEVESPHASAASSAPESHRANEGTTSGLTCISCHIRLSAALGRTNTESGIVGDGTLTGSYSRSASLADLGLGSAGVHMQTRIWQRPPHQILVPPATSAQLNSRLFGNSQLQNLILSAAIVTGRA